MLQHPNIEIIWWIMYYRLLVAFAAMVLSILCFDSIGTDDLNTIAAEEKASVVQVNAEVSGEALPAETLEAVREAIGEGVLYTPLAGRSLVDASFMTVHHDGDTEEADGASDKADDIVCCIFGEEAQEHGSDDSDAQTNPWDEIRRVEAERRAAAEKRRIAEEKHRIAEEKAAEQRRIAAKKAAEEAALRAACPGYDDAFVATLTTEEQAEARWFYERGYVFYRQNWSSVKDAVYGDCGFGQCGCGPTCVAAIISNLAGVPVDPEEMRVYGLSVGSWLPSGGTTYGFLIETAKKYGITATQIYAGDKASLFAALKDENKLVLATMGPGDFTLGAHFMLFRGITDDGKILIADSYSFENSVKAWDYDVLYSQLKTGYWIFEKTN